MSDHEEVETGLPLDIVTLPKKDKFLTVVDALPIGRIKCVITHYDSDTKAAKSSGKAFLDIRIARVLCAKIKLWAAAEVQALFNKTVLHDKVTILEQFGGGGYGDDCISTAIRVIYDTNNGSFIAQPWRFEIVTGKGIRTATQAITPVKDGPKETSFVRLSTDELLNFSENVLAYFDVRKYDIMEQAEQAQKERRQRRADRRSSGALSIQSARNKLPMAFRGYAAGTPINQLDRAAWTILATKGATMPLIAAEAQALLKHS